MKKTVGKGYAAERRKRSLAILMIWCLIGAVMPVSVRAEAGTGEPESSKYFEKTNSEISFKENSNANPVEFKITGRPTDATVRTINLDPAVLRPKDGTWNGDNNSSSLGNKNMVWFGKWNGYSVEYRVLSSPNTQSCEECLLLDCYRIVKCMAFDEDGQTNTGQTNPNEWTGSDLESWLNGNGFYENTSAFSVLERAAIAETGLLDLGECSIDGVGEYTDCSASDHVFCLSMAEAEGLYAGGCKADNGDKIQQSFEGADFSHKYWLRSVKILSGGNMAVCVNKGGGEVHQSVESNVTSAIGVGPAFNVKLSSILFASKADAGVKTDTLTEVTEASNTVKWKLTLLDDAKTVEVTDGKSVTRADQEDGSVLITVPYTYTDENTANAVDRISVMITDKEYEANGAQILYYGALQGSGAKIENGGASGTGTFTLPDDYANKKSGKDYYVYLIAEDVNQFDETDYAGEPVQITIPDMVSSVDITLAAPEAGVKLADAASCATEGVESVVLTEWTPADTEAGYHTAYTAELTLSAAKDYQFAEKVTATVNGRVADRVRNEDGTLTVTYEFPKTEKDSLVSIKAPDKVCVANGTAYENMGLPTKVEIETKGKTVTETSVVWDTTMPLSGSYDPAILTEQTFTLQGTVSCPDAIKSGNVSLTTQITVCVAAAEVPVITAQPESVTVSAGDAAVFSVSASGMGLTWQWMLDRNDGNGSEKIPGATAAAYTISAADMSCNGFRYWCAVTNSAGTVTVNSNPATLTVQDTGSTATPSVSDSDSGSGQPSGGDTDTPSVSDSDIPGGGGSDQPAGDDTDTSGGSSPVTSYLIMEGACGRWTMGSGEGLTIRGSGAFDRFTGVTVDDVPLDPAHYTAEEGSTIVTLQASYLNTLAVGEHTVELLWTDGFADTTFTILAAASGNGDNGQSANGGSSDKSTSPQDADAMDSVPQTGDVTETALPAVLLALSGIGLLFSRKRAKALRR